MAESTVFENPLLKASKMLPTIKATMKMKPKKWKQICRQLAKQFDGFAPSEINLIDLDPSFSTKLPGREISSSFFSRLSKSARKRAEPKHLGSVRMYLTRSQSLSCVLRSSEVNKWIPLVWLRNVISCSLMDEAGYRKIISFSGRSEFERCLFRNLPCNFLKIPSCSFRRQDLGDWLRIRLQRPSARKDGSRGVRLRPREQSV